MNRKEGEGAGPSAGSPLRGAARRLLRWWRSQWVIGFACPECGRHPILRHYISGWSQHLTCQMDHSWYECDREAVRGLPEVASAEGSK